MKTVEFENICLAIEEGLPIIKLIEITQTEREKRIIDALIKRSIYRDEQAEKTLFVAKLLWQLIHYTGEIDLKKFKDFLLDYHDETLTNLKNSNLGLIRDFIVLSQKDKKNLDDFYKKGKM
jgi:hypothetical protein